MAPDMVHSPKIVNITEAWPIIFPSTTATGLLVRMDAEPVAAETVYAEELHVLMAYYFSVSV